MYKERDGREIGVPGVSMHIGHLNATIDTPESNWCTDACGVLFVQTTVACPTSDNPTEAGIFTYSGQLFSDKISITLESPDTDEAVQPPSTPTDPGSGTSLLEP